MAVSSRFAELLDDPWTVNAGRFPSQATPDGKLRFILNYAVLAPSLLNTQPWRFRVRDGKLSLFADFDRRLPVTDPHDRELVIGGGAALLNLRVALQSFGGIVDVSILPDRSDPALLALLRLAGVTAPSDSDRLLRDAIPQRHTYRGAFDNRALPPSLFNELQSAALNEGANVAFLDDASRKKQAGELIAEAAGVQLDDLRFRRELSTWINERVSGAALPPSEALFRLAGHLPQLPPQSELFIPTAANVSRTFPSDAARDPHRTRAESSPALALIVTKDDSPAEWMAAGQALQRVLLTATLAGVSASFLSAPIEVETTRPRLAEIFDEPGYAQVFLRLGYGAAQLPIPRKRPADVLV